MRKDLLRETLQAYRSSHKSVPSEQFIVKDFSFPSGFEHVNDASNLYVPSTDGLFVIQCEAVSGSTRVSLTLRKGEMDVVCVEVPSQTWPVAAMPCKKGESVRWYAGLDGQAQQITAHIRFYPYIGS